MRYHPRVDQGVDTCASVLIISVDPDTYHAVGLKGRGGGGSGGRIEQNKTAGIIVSFTLRV